MFLTVLSLQRVGWSVIHFGCFKLCSLQWNGLEADKLCACCFWPCSQTEQSSSVCQSQFILLGSFFTFSLNILNDCVKKNIIGLQLRFDSPREKLCYHDNITALFLDCENSVFYLGFHFIHLNEIQGKIYSIFYLGCTEMFIAATWKKNLDVCINPKEKTSSDNVNGQTEAADFLSSRFSSWRDDVK